jgi:plastocyanin
MLEFPPDPENAQMNRNRFVFSVAAVLYTSSLLAAGAVTVRVNFLTRRGQHPVPAETLVWLEPQPGTKVPHPLPTQKYQLVTRSKSLVPRILAIPMGATVQFPNDDPISHNLFSLSTPNGFDLGLYRRGSGKEHVFTSPGIVNVYCNVHPNMAAVIHVLDTPYYTLADGTGSASLPGVVPGRYRLIAWNEQSGSAAIPIEVAADGSVRGSTLITIDSRSARSTAAHPNKFGQSYSGTSGDRDY